MSMIVGLRRIVPIAFFGLVPQILFAQVAAGIGKATTEPLRDTRLRDEKIPVELQLARSAPYTSVGTTSCATIAAEISKLDAVLGSDADVPSKTKGEGAEVASAAAGEAVRSIVPGLGLVKVVTGADKHQRRVEAAVYAGGIRRAYLKGLGAARHCPSGAAPSVESRQAKPEPDPSPDESRGRSETRRSRA